VTHPPSGPQYNESVLADLASLFCRGGLVVEAPGGPTSISIRSTIQLDGDMMICMARYTIEDTILISHLVEVEKRIRRVALFIKRAVGAVHAFLWTGISVAWLCVLYDRLTPEDGWTTVAIWIGLSTGSTGLIEYILRIPLLQQLFLTSVASGLSRLARDEQTSGNSRS